MSAITQNLQAVHAQIVHAARAAKRPDTAVRLLAVSKTFDFDAVVTAMLAGQTAFGENYLQESLVKIAAVQAAQPDSHIEWHFIGPIQSNKTRPIAENFAWVHTVERLKVAQRLSQQRPSTLAPLNVCLQINISGEASKSGVAADEALALARELRELPNLRLRGLMAIPEPLAAGDARSVEQQFAQMQQLFQQLQSEFNDADFDTLSMGMSSDLDLAIAHGSTLVRVGSAIFGQRKYNNGSDAKNENTH